MQRGGLGKTTNVGTSLLHSVSCLGGGVFTEDYLIVLHKLLELRLSFVGQHCIIKVLQN